ncbi:hypothetical protein SAMN05216302_10767 [Nitrosomonas aestuarii]|uniref:Pentapeptide MXKDX repeat protein n=1 Tax=Nitrosomonas aestuarii TaxID=52441 RepID=A0A1I4HCV3_9PROT|nr:hypothetical protein [Nitrosomonas aestuarii]SFL39271.1 hypothetical protein SAMN05216302_10767 [Nitrosomonas aestuarii]
MIQVKKTAVMAFIISTVFLVASTSAIAEYSQTQNEVDDKMDSGKQSQNITASKQKNDEDKSGKSSSDQSDRNTKKPAEMDKKTSSGTEKKGSY